MLQQVYFQHRDDHQLTQFQLPFMMALICLEAVHNYFVDLDVQMKTFVFDARANAS